MAQTAYNVYLSFYTVVVIFGISGNILVIVSLLGLRQRRLLKNNYYFFVLHLAICDQGWLMAKLFPVIHCFVTGDWAFKIPFIDCLLGYVRHVFQFAGIYMMLIIAILRYRAAVHPLKHHISRRKLKVICCSGYILGLIVECGTSIPRCFLPKNVDDYKNEYLYAYLVFVLYFGPTSVMAVLYYKAYQALEKQNKYLRSLCSIPAEENFSSSFKILRYIRNRRTYFVCLATVLCYGIGNLFVSLRYILKIAHGTDLLKENTWILDLAYILQVAATASVNPLIYGIGDKTMHPFGKCCSKKKKICTIQVK